LPIEETELGRFRLPVNPVQFENAELPIDVTELGMTRLPVSALQPEKALFPIEVTVIGIVIEPVFEVGQEIRVVMVLLYRIPSIVV
jgi:hypothetical protein